MTFPNLEPYDHRLLQTFQYRQIGYQWTWADGFGPMIRDPRRFSLAWDPGCWELRLEMAATFAIFALTMHRFMELQVKVARQDGFLEQPPANWYRIDWSSHLDRFQKDDFRRCLMQKEVEKNDGLAIAENWFGARPSTAVSIVQ